MKTTNFRLLFLSLPFLTKKQIAYRLYYRIRNKTWALLSLQAPKFPKTAWKEFILFPGFQNVRDPGPWKEQVEGVYKRAEAISQLQFEFLNHRVSYQNQPYWSDPEVSQLWRYHLHYFDYVDDLIVWGGLIGHQRSYEVFQDLSLSWIAGNRRLRGDGWHPFTLSIRLVNWIKAHAHWWREFQEDPHFTQVFEESLQSQLGVLKASLEFDVRGNHLIKNLRALIAAGIALNGPHIEAWMEHALGILEQEIREQILRDGAHFERSPGYHLSVLKDCLEIGYWWRLNRPESRLAWLEEALDRMFSFLLTILPPDNELPLLKDTVIEGQVSARDLLAAGALYFNNPNYKIDEAFGLYPLLLFGQKGWQTFRSWPIGSLKKTSVSLPESGYYILRDDSSDNYLIFDGGKPCPDYLPAHAHADLFSFELMVDHQRVIVDSGVYEYKAGLWRDFFRSTRAHNTVEVQGKNQSEVWSSFRVARRARPIKVFLEENDPIGFLQGIHDGYQRLSEPVTHRRTIIRKKNCFWGIIDELWGEGQVESKNHIHFHPSLNLEYRGDLIWEIVYLPFPLWITSFGQKDHALIQGQTQPVLQGWYSDGFGKLTPNQVLSLAGPEILPAIYGYIISRELPAKAQVFKTENGYQIPIRYDNTVYPFLIPQIENPYLE